MVGPIHNGGMEDMDCGSFFDHIDDLLDFPMNENDIDAAGLPGRLDSFPSIWTAGSDSVFSNTNSDLSAQLSVPYEDIVQLEWLSNFVEDSFAGDGSLAVNNSTKQETSNLTKEEPFHTGQFHTTSPVSVLESSSSSFGEKPGPDGLAPLPGGRRGKARSKRARPATFNPRPAMQLISPTASSVAENLAPSVSLKALSDSENYAESRPAVIKIPKQPSLENGEPKKKKKKIKLTIVQKSGDAGENSLPGQAVRKCLHCEITKTPQWRAGPLGPKTLCNACGVRYKSGRLFPEYRPAASPTFIPAVHSNSHKKVLEMRSKMGPVSTTGTPTELIPNPTVPLDYM
ncbi:GATA transcription factor 8-like [Punica granatum]|uniref:GATA transcription factor n=1 Tax=Punica granatum TaxID=22663 RepID=A0A6P8BVN2_PUNGR|nr:GATA transcription factor 8-like [Punica granatum]